MVAMNTGPRKPAPRRLTWKVVWTLVCLVCFLVAAITAITRPIALPAQVQTSKPTVTWGFVQGDNGTLVSVGGQ